MKRIALLLFAGLFGFATLQTATAQKHDVTIDVSSINNIEAPGNVDITVDPSIGDFTGTGTTDGGYDVASNSGSQKVQVEATNISANNVNSGDLVSLEILSSGTAAPGNAEANNVTLVAGGEADGEGAKDLTGAFSGVNSQNNAVQYEAEVSPGFSPGEDNNITVTVTYTLVEAGDSG